jgi:hypothetical protein
MSSLHFKRQQERHDILDLLRLQNRLALPVGTDARQPVGCGNRPA